MMQAELQQDAVNALFERYRQSCDSEQKLRPVTADTDIAGLWENLEQDMGLDSDLLCQQIAELSGLPCFTEEINPDSKLAKRIPVKTRNRFQITVVGLQNDEPIIATANPFDPDLHATLEFIFGYHYHLVVARPDKIAAALAATEQRGSGARESAHGISLNEAGHSAVENRAIPRLARKLMARALSVNASDMHVQPFMDGSVVRIRVDGLLQRVTLLPAKVASALIRHFKAESGMDPTLNRIPQDGRMLVNIDNREYDLRISTLPVAGHQEKLVVRFLGRQSVLHLLDLGFSLDEMHAIQRLSARPSGVILVCGPTGSGKTTTLYSVLSSLNNEETSIMTVENPVEYQVQGLSQTEVNDKAGMTFPRALRAILRQDPDVLLIGEIRDEETAQIAMQSALTGHLVFSTLHTNDALGAIPRLLDLGINPVILAESLCGIMSQRLLRTLCTKCRQPVTEDPDPAARAFAAVTHVQQGYRPVGCPHCDHSGYKGRTVVAEVIEINQLQRELLLGGESDIAKFKDAMRGSFNSMSMAASRLIISGTTTASEATRVIGQQFWFELAREYDQPVPDLSALTESQKGQAVRNAVLLIGNPDDPELAQLEAVLNGTWMTVMTANTPESANTILHEHDEVSFVILNLPAELTADEAVATTAEYRREIAWSRLPALLRIPVSKPDWESLLKEHGATSRFVDSAVSAEAVTAMVQKAINDRLDFKWGVVTDKVHGDGDTTDNDQSSTP